MSQQVEGPAKAFTAGEALTIWRRVKFTSSDTVVYADAGDDWIGITQDTVASGAHVSVRLRTAEGTMKMTASAAIDIDDIVYGSADGKISDVVAGAPVGRALEAASADASVIEILTPVDVSTGTDGLVVGVATQSLVYSNFTDDLGTSGHIDSTGDQIPAGAVVLGFKAAVTTGFANDTTAVIEVGVAGDTDRFSAVTDQSVLTSATVVGAGPATDACDGMDAPQTIRVTVTGTADFSSINAGGMAVTVYYIATV